MDKKEQKYSSLAIAAFVLGFIPVLSIMGFVLGIIALVTMPKDKKLKGKGFAIAAIAIGFVMSSLIILIIVSSIKFFGAIFGGIMASAERDIQVSIDNCRAQDKGFGRDMCIIMALNIHLNQTNKLDKSVCDEIATEGLPDYCLALVTKNKEYCKSLTGENRINCYGLLEELGQQAGK